MRTLGERIWLGWSPSVRAARKNYLRNKNRATLLAYASALYSFQWNLLGRHSRSAFELAKLRPELEALMAELMAEDNGIVRGKFEFAMQTEMLATYLESLSRWPEFDADTAERLLQGAEEMSGRGRWYAATFAFDAEEGAHVFVLHQLTAVWLDMRRKNYEAAGDLLFEVAESNFLLHIRDPNQKARIYRKLGSLLRRLGKILDDEDMIRDGRFRSAQAFRVPGSTLMVRLKSIAGFLGFKP